MRAALATAAGAALTEGRQAAQDSGRGHGTGTELFQWRKIVWCGEVEEQWRI